MFGCGFISCPFSIAVVIDCAYIIGLYNSIVKKKISFFINKIMPYVISSKKVFKHPLNPFWRVSRLSAMQPEEIQAAAESLQDQPVELSAPGPTPMTLEELQGVVVPFDSECADYIDETESPVRAEATKYFRGNPLEMRSLEVSGRNPGREGLDSTHDPDPHENLLWIREGS